MMGDNAGDGRDAGDSGDANWNYDDDDGHDEKLIALGLFHGGTTFTLRDAYKLNW